VSDADQHQNEIVDQISRIARARALSVGIAESLTGGAVSTALARGDHAADWYRGSLVAYAPEVKFDVLGVDPGPVACARCATQMADGALALLACDIAVSTTGVGGPEPDDGVPAGTVFIGCARRGHQPALSEHHLVGDPQAVVDQTVERALESVLRALSKP
jgi:nicotinamide-nucleotide amidase